MDERRLLEAAEARANEAEANMRKAAEYGQQILQDLSESQKIRTELEQEKHSLKLQLQNSEASEKSAQDEIQELSKKITHLENSLKSQKDIQRNFDLEKLEFSQKEENFREKIVVLEEKLAKIQEELAANSEIPSSPNISLQNSSIFGDLRDEVEILKDQNSNFREENLRLKAENDELNHLSHSLRLEISELKSENEEKDEELFSYRESIKQSNEEMKMLNLEMEEIEPNIEISKGNSLFSEVEDRRHIAEEQLKKATAKKEEFKILLEKKTREMQKLKMQNIHLMNMSANSGGKFDQALVDRLNSMLQIEKDKNKDLMAKISGEISNDDFVKKLMTQSLYEDEKLREFSKQSAILERQNASLKAENYKLKTRLEEKRSPNNVQEVQDKKPKFKFEDIKFEKKSPEEKKAVLTLQDENLPKLEPLKKEIQQKETKKKVQFLAVEGQEEIENKAKEPLKKSGQKKAKKTDHVVLDADEEVAKMEEQCKQQ